MHECFFLIKRALLFLVTRTLITYTERDLAPGAKGSVRRPVQHTAVVCTSRVSDASRLSLLTPSIRPQMEPGGREPFRPSHREPRLIDRRLPGSLRVPPLQIDMLSHRPLSTRRLGVGLILEEEL